MSKWIRNLLVLVILLAGTTLWGQVLVDFEDGTTGSYAQENWGGLIHTDAVVADTTGRGGMVWQLDLSIPGATEPKDPILTYIYEDHDWAVLHYWVYIPADMPDSIAFKVFAQDMDWWTWNQELYWAVDLNRGAWNALTIDIGAITAGGVPMGNGIKTGLEIAAWDSDDPNYTGIVFVDDIAMYGVEPTDLADFEDGNTGAYATENWGGMIHTDAVVADTTGRGGMVWQLDLDIANATEPKDPILTYIYEGHEDAIMHYWVYVPADMPDNIEFKVFVQDMDWWTWNQNLYMSQDLNRGSWNALMVDVSALTASGIPMGNGIKTGLEIAAWSAADPNWTGTVFVDDIDMLTTHTGTAWNVYNFESAAAGIMGWWDGNWGDALTALERYDDNGNGVLSSHWVFTSDMASPKDALGNTLTLTLTNPDDVTVIDTAYLATVDVYLPADMPVMESSQISISIRNGDWTELKFPIVAAAATPGDSAVVGQWNTLEYDLAAKYALGELDPGAATSLDIQVQFDATVPDWTGDIYWDNFMLHGLTEPVGEFVSPVTTVEESYYQLALDSVQVNMINWVDLTVANITYNLYMSSAEITDLTADGVVKIAGDIPGGTETWMHRPYAASADAATYYYAVTAMNLSEEESALRTEATTGPATCIPSMVATIVYAPNFSSEFSHDGLNSEFLQFSEFEILPESAGDANADGWNHESADLMWKTTLVMDDDYLYISADVTDDELSLEMQAWQGDALEFFFGIYDGRDLAEWHAQGQLDVEGSGDNRIAFMANGTMQKNGYIPWDWPGVELVSFQKLTFDGYIIEARLDLDSVSVAGETFEPMIGMMMPFRIDGNDNDPTQGDETRTLSSGWGSVSNPENWLRPHSWGWAQIVSPTGVDQTLEVPYEYRLSNAYPNPFNPVANLQYEVPEATEVKLTIYNLMGQEVRTLVNDMAQPGVHNIQWNTLDNKGRAVASGVYLYRLETAEFTQTMKMTLLR